jgi:hypothetical protein
LTVIDPKGTRVVEDAVEQVAGYNDDYGNTLPPEKTPNQVYTKWHNKCFPDF